ncbi:MAG: hypothetical protein AAF251_08065 [Pseudomonadota bacterium]
MNNIVTGLKVFCALSVGLVMSGCTTSLSSSVEPKKASSIRPGVPYRLPVAEVDATITRTLTRCEVITITYKPRINRLAPKEIESVKDDKGRFLRKINGSNEIVHVFDLDSVGRPSVWPEQYEIQNGRPLKVEFKITASHEVEYLGGTLLSIDPDDMASAFKTSSLSVGYHENTLQLSSINASIEGKEPEAVGTGIKIASSVAALTLGLPPVPLPVGSATKENRPDPWSISACEDKAVETTKAYAATISKLKALTVEATNSASTLTALNKKKDSGTASAADLERLTSLTARGKKLEARIKDETAKKTDLEKILSRSVSKTLFNSDAGAGASGPIKDDIADDELNTWLADLIRDLDKKFTPDGKKENELTVREAIKGQVRVFASLTPFEKTYACNDGCELSVPEKPPAQNEKPQAPKPGVLYRIPISSLLLITTRDSSRRITDVSGARKQRHDLVFETVMVPQFGPIRSLPLKSDWGEKNNLTATFAKSGLPTAIAYTRENAPGVSALGAVDEAVKAALSVRDQIEAEKVASTAAAVDKEQAEIDALTRRVNLLTKQKELEDLLAEPNQDLLNLQAQLARLELLASIKAQEDLLSGDSEEEDEPE